MEDKEFERLMKLSDDPQVKNLLNLVLLRVVRNRAESFEFHPSGKRLIYYVEGREYECIPIPERLYEGLIARM